ncbi:hypothetical protein JAAARDRAFT_142195 [Jaapia argillacea MUCL 33604]|uniref:Uncharacterized protein n=1 Tax=Jaapia argillacea MUCL 33604 TaxID=933084 RepID=A0A067P927_9AGAM|nr:hypothetical protein JAAARDRAFT_142195 [Jaapia argillacea MUCL 33604]
MCHGQNSAHRVVHYLNAQLGVHWENAVTCLEHSGRSSTLAASAQYDVALAQYHYAPGSQHHHSKTSSQDAVMFRAVFGKPRLEFICNHQAVLYLKIKEGHYDVDYTKGEGHRRSRSHKVELNDLELAFRMDFSTETMPRVHNSKSRPGNQLIHLVVLDFSAAQLVSKVDLNGPQDAIIFYLRKYLDLLQEAGHDVLFSLPEFDDDRLGLHIDHSIDSHSIQNFDPRCQPSSISGVSIGDVNDHLASKWLQAAIHAEDVERGYVELDRQAVCLAESRSTWLVGSEGWDTQFHVKFGAPEVKILCKREVSFHLKVDELMVYEGSDFTLGAKRLFSDWEVVFLVGLICEKEAEGAITRLKLDMSSIRFCERLAVFTNLDASDPSTHSFKPRLVHFFHTYYFPFIESTSHHIIYQEDTRQPQTPSTYGRSRSRSGTVTSTTPSENKSLLPWELSVRKTNMCGFDFIQVISSESISEHYKTLWGAAQSSEEDYVRCLWKWSYDHYFEATFGPLTLHFLSSGKVILWVDVKEGHLQNLRNWLAWSEEKEYRFKDWRLAFQVDLKMFDHGEVSWSSKSWIHRFMESFSLRKDIVQGHCTVRHLCLDLSNAQFIYELSTFHGMTLSHRAALRRVRAAAYYVKEHYFHYLTYYGHHLLYSIPFWHPGTSPPPMALTDVSFQVHSTHGSIHHKHEPKWSTTDASIFILGMTSFRRPPSTPVDFTANWIAQAREGLSHGIVSLSKKLFLEDHLLRILAKVNAETTIVPVFPAVDGEGDWHLELTTWSKRRKGKECRWELVRDHERRIGYKWENCDKWIYEHEGADEDGDNGVYAMACKCFGAWLCGGLAGLMDWGRSN